MAQSPDTEGKDIINLNDLGLGDQQMLQEEELNQFLEDEAAITGNPNDIKPNDDDDDTPPTPPSKKPDPKTSPEDKEKELLEKKKALEAEEAKKKAALAQHLTGEETDDDTTDEGQEDDLAQSIAAFSKQLHKLGLFTKDSDDEPEELKTPEELLAKTQNTFKKGTLAYLESVLSKHGPKYRQAFSAIYEKGVDPELYFAQLGKLDSFEKMDLENEANQERIVTQAFRNQKWDEEDIKDEIKKLKDYKELESTAKKYHKGLVREEQAQTKALEEQAEREAERLQQIDEDYDNNLRRIYNEKLKDKDFGGIPLTETVVSKAYDFAYNKKWELNGAKLTDMDRFFLDLKRPENYELRAQIAALIAPTYEPNKPLKVDFSKIQKRAVSAKTDELFRDLARKDKTGGKTNSSYKQAVKSFFD